MCEEKNRPRTFASEQEAFDWLLENDKDFANIPKEDIPKVYNIKPYVV